MTFIPRNYDQIVEDMLTSITGGEVGETHLFDETQNNYELGTDQSNISNITMVYSLNQEGINKVFVPEIDYVHVKPNILSFIQGGSRPDNGTLIKVNYYLEDIEPVITDRNVGSVARTITEAFSREIAILFSQLNIVYKSAFIETASGTALDMLVSILGINRFKGGFATGVVRFSRNTPAPGDITIPAATIVSDLADKPLKYLITKEKILRAGQLEVDVPVRATVKEQTSKARTIVLMPKPVLGIEKIENPEETVIGTKEETDDELRSRARRIIKGSTTATIEAMKLALLGIPHLSSVNIVDRPKGVNGRVDIIVDTEKDFNTISPEINEILYKLKPAGIYIDVSATTKVYPQYDFTLIPKTSITDQETTSLQTEISNNIDEYFKSLKPGENVQAKRLVSIILSSDKIYDVTYNSSEVKLLDKDKQELMSRGLLNGDIFVNTSEKITFQNENIALNFLAEESIYDSGAEDEVIHPVFVDVIIMISIETDRFDFRKIKKIIEGKTRLFFDNLTQGDRFYLKDLFLALEDEESRYIIIKSDSMIRTIHSMDGIILNLRSDNDIDEIRNQEELRVLSVEISQED